MEDEPALSAMHVVAKEGALPEPVFQAVILLGVPVGLLHSGLTLFGVIQKVFELAGDVLVICNDYLVPPLCVQLWLQGSLGHHEAAQADCVLQTTHLLQQNMHTCSCLMVQNLSLYEVMQRVPRLAGDVLVVRDDSWPRLHLWGQ